MTISRSTHGSRCCILNNNNMDVAQPLVGFTLEAPGCAEQIIFAGQQDLEGIDDRTCLEEQLRFPPQNLSGGTATLELRIEGESCLQESSSYALLGATNYGISTIEGPICGVSCA